MMRRVEANDVGAIYQQAGYYYSGLEGFQQDRAKAMDLYVRAAELGCKKAHYCLGVIYMGEGDLKKAKFHFEAAAISGHEMARFNLAIHENNSGNIERALKHLTIAASAGHYKAMHQLRTFFKEGVIKRESIDSTLEAYNNSCAEMRSKARDAYIVLWRIGRTA
jgi:TPR repeat protein